MSAPLNAASLTANPVPDSYRVRLHVNFPSFPGLTTESEENWTHFLTTSHFPRSFHRFLPCCSCIAQGGHVQSSQNYGGTFETTEIASERSKAVVRGKRIGGTKNLFTRRNLATVILNAIFNNRVIIRPGFLIPLRPTRRKRKQWCKFRGLHHALWTTFYREESAVELGRWYRISRVHRGCINVDWTFHNRPLALDLSTMRGFLCVPDRVRIIEIRREKGRSIYVYNLAFCLDSYRRILREKGIIFNNWVILKRCSKMVELSPLIVIVLKRI